MQIEQKEKYFNSLFTEKKLLKDFRVPNKHQIQK